VRLRVAGPALLLALLLAAPAARAAQVVEGVRFAASLVAGDASLALRGASLLRYRVVIRAYVAALYLPPEIPSARALDDVPKRLEIEYFWAIRAADFARATDTGIARNVDEAKLAQLRPRIDALSALYRDVEPGSRYAITYVPGRGTELALDGDRLGLVEGADFAAALFAIWLGDEPLDAGLKDRLLDCPGSC
jgi:hypothetical protein